MVQELKIRDTYLGIFPREQIITGCRIPITRAMALKILDISTSTLFRWEEDLGLDVTRVNYPSGLTGEARSYSDEDLLILAKKAKKRVRVSRKNGKVILKSRNALAVLDDEL